MNIAPKPLETESPLNFFRRHRFWLALIASVALCALLAYGGYRLYRKVQPARLAAKAREHFEKKDYRGASLAARSALEINPFNIEAIDVMAGIAEAINSPYSLVWRRRLVLLEPGSASRKLDLAKLAVRFKKTDLARETLKAIPKEARNSADYHGTAGAVAMSAGKFQEARAEFEAALIIEPNNDHYKFLHACMLLSDKSAAARQERQQTLEHLASESSDLRTQAMRALLLDAASSGNHKIALERAKELQARKEARFDDRLLYLTLLHAAEAPEFDAYLDDLKKRVEQDPKKFSELIAWLTDQDLESDAIAWSKSVNQTMLRTMPAGLAMALAFEKAGQWKELADLLEDSNWGQLEFLRLTYDARAQRETGDTTGWRTPWNRALTMASQLPGASRQLYALVQRWGWESEARVILWEIAKGASEAPWALDQLYRYYRKTQDTVGLRTTVARMAELSPDNEIVRNNHAMFSMLLNVDLSEAFTDAQSLYGKHPDNPIFISTYAFALLKQDKPAEALAVLNTLSREQISDPSISLYYGVALARTGAAQLAGTFLDRADAAPLLAEEREMLVETRKSLPAAPQSADNGKH